MTYWAARYLDSPTMLRYCPAAHVTQVEPNMPKARFTPSSVVCSRISARPGLSRPDCASPRRSIVTLLQTHKQVLRRLTLSAVFFATIFAASAAFFLPRTSAGDDWQPISPDELKMTSDPKAPGAPAINLYRQVDRDDESFHENNYVRIKILAEEGRHFGDVSIPLFKAGEQINSIKARTIHPDGSIVNFDGKVYLAPMLKTKNLKIMAKTFTL